MEMFQFPGDGDDDAAGPDNDLSGILGRQAELLGTDRHALRNRSMHRSRLRAVRPVGSRRGNRRCGRVHGATLGKQKHMSSIIVDNC